MKKRKAKYRRKKAAPKKGLCWALGYIDDHGRVQPIGVRRTRELVRQFKRNHVDPRDKFHKILRFEFTVAR